MYKIGVGPELSINQGEGNLLTKPDTQHYQSVVGSAMYLAQVSRYDILYGVNQLTRAMSNASKAHIGATQTPTPLPHRQHRFRHNIQARGFKLTVFSDANWGNNPDNGKSTLSYVMMMCNGPVSFKVGMQGIIAQSTMETEVVAAALAMKEAIYCAGMMGELEFEETFTCVPIHIDNNSALHVAGNKT